MLETSLYLGVTEPHFSHIYIFFFNQKNGPKFEFFEIIKTFY